MTTSSQALLNRAVIEIVADLAQPLTPESRYRRLLAALCQMFPCDAAALLQLRGGILLPLAVQGLSDDTFGRRFNIAEHPRLSQIVSSREPVRFIDSDLPDPYDGLVEGAQAPLPVHDCIGVTLQIDNRPWGVLTLDALRPGTFDAIDPIALEAFVRLTEASVKAAQTIDALRAEVDRAHEFSQLLAERDPHELIGKSAPMQALRRAIETVAASDLLVLILGETGVGKELVAQQVHRQSTRARQTLIHVNCAALPETLAESELFGHKRGAFTGASSDRAGKFELAHGGTLLLDEVGELPLSIQAKLLRVLQSGEIQRVGSDRTALVDVRVIAATNRDLKSEVAAGRFRADLYHRLSVFPIHVPPLRERGRDVLALAGYFLELNQRRLHTNTLRLSSETKQALLDYDWPGNVRELEHVMSRAALLAAAEKKTAQRWITIEPQHVGALATAEHSAAGREEMPTKMPAKAPSATLAQATAEFQAQWLRQLLAANDNNIAAAARRAGMDRSNLFRLLKKIGLR